MFKFIKWINSKYVEDYMNFYGDISEAGRSAIETAGGSVFGV